MRKWVLTKKRCTVCKDNMTLTRHHIIFKRNGGANKPGNYQWLCRMCHDRAHKLGVKSGQRVTLKLIRMLERIKRP